MYIKTHDAAPRDDPITLAYRSHCYYDKFKSKVMNLSSRKNNKRASNSLTTRKEDDLYQTYVLNVF